MKRKQNENEINGIFVLREGLSETVDAPSKTTKMLEVLRW